ncbi:hypothetical protein ABZ865_30140 [Streptomyces sp. NPDC047085]|uniref:hypothetical protein n=1 Tax=Streptomyces sp. NPDC047085 TaxID=3155140 RepID=UPI0034058D7D
MEATTGTRVPRKLTDKGQATRTRILEHAQLRRGVGLSGSQLNHYFPTKESPVLAVIARQADRVLAFHRGERFASFDDLDAFREWADFYVGYERAYQEGCSLGSLVSEICRCRAGTGSPRRVRARETGPQ